MASPLKKLAGQTAIYGFSSILGRLLNYALTPLYTSAHVFTTDQYGIITEMYSYVAFLVVLLMYGMETAFFRFYSNSDQKTVVYSTAIWSLAFSTFAFIALTSLFSGPISSTLGYPNHQEYIIWFAIIVGLDALIAIPLARLRAENKPIRFALINFSFIGVNIGLNLFFLWYCLPEYQSGNANWLIDTFYNPEIGVGYVFISNLIASIVRFALALPDLGKIRVVFDTVVWKNMMRYGTPLLIVGLAGIINETLDKPLLKWILIPTLGEEEAMSQVGIYGGVYKLSIAITLFVQAYRYAAEPFFFDQKDKSESKATYAKMLHWFTGFVLFAFLVITLYIDVFKHFLQSEAYWEALDIVPVLILANVCLGIYYNLSVWYKLTDKTIYGSYMAVLGAVITISFNLILIPKIGFRGAAYTTLICYASMAVVSFLVGQRHYHVPYSVPKIATFFGLALFLFTIDRLVTINPIWLAYSLKALLIAMFVSSVYFVERKSSYTQ